MPPNCGRAAPVTVATRSDALHGQALAESDARPSRRVAESVRVARERPYFPRPEAPGSALASCAAELDVRSALHLGDEPGA
jgi:hypothetical protein